MHSAAELIQDIRNGKMVVLVDDEDRENEGDLVIAADFVTPQAINFMVSEAKGLVCLSLTPEQIERLKLPLMIGETKNLSPNKTAFTVSIEASRGVSTGISASDRSQTIRVAASPGAKPDDIIIPGHIFPIRGQRGGVLKRAGHTEGSIDLAKLAGLNPAAAICEIMKPDGSMARLPELKEFAKKHDLKIGTIEDLIRYRLANETLVEQVSEAAFPTRFSEDFKVKIFKNILDDSENVVIQKGEIDPHKPTLVRVQVENILGDVFHSGFSAQNIESTLKHLAQAERGVFIYLRKEGSDSLISQQVEKMKNKKTKTKMDPREYGIGAQILKILGVSEIHLLANRKPNNVALKGFGLEIVDTVPLVSGNKQTEDENELFLM